MAKQKNVVVVDLDETLLKSDILYESFLSAVANDWRNIFKSLSVLLWHGKPTLKKFLSKKSNLDLNTLPFDKQILYYIEKCKAKGCHLALVTATNHHLAKLIAEKLGLFDEVYGSDDKTNLKGAKKADFLVSKYGTNNFTYLGDSYSDLPVWRVAKNIVLVNGSTRLLNKARKLGKEIEHLETSKRSLASLFISLRPHQWVKNLLLFLPVIAAHSFETVTVLQSLIAFVSFCFLASSVYILNDMLDLKADRLHPRKKLRPFASGTIPLKYGALSAIILIVLGMMLASILNTKFFLMLLIYFILTTSYSLRLKQIMVLDICILAGLYTLRIFAGALATDIELSVWLLAFSLFFFLSLAGIKRQAELVDLIDRSETVVEGRGYNIVDLPVIRTLALSSGYISVLVLALYLNSSSTQTLYTFPEALWAICFILIYWITRIAVITNRGGMNDDPIVFAFKDKLSKICLVLIFVVVFIGAFF